MRLPRPSAAYAQRVRFGRYVARRRRRAKLGEMAEAVAAATALVKAKGRAWEDAEEGLSDSFADRDGADDDLDATAQEARLALASRSLDATSKEPYTSVFPDGIEYYTAAPISEETRRYGELADRLKKSLPPKDPVRVEAIPKIEDGIVAFKAACEAIDAGRTALSLASTELAAAEDAWTKLAEKTYGALVEKLDRKRADRFFPKIGTAKRATASESAPIGS